MIIEAPFNDESCGIWSKNYGDSKKQRICLNWGWKAQLTCEPALYRLADGWIFLPTV